MKVKIIPEKFLENAQSEENLLENSIMESIYEIRRLKVALTYGNKIIEIEKTTPTGQIFIEALDIWINADEYIKV